MAKPAPLTITTTCRLELDLSPVPMPVMPSSNNAHWLAFIEDHRTRYGYQLSAETAERVQGYMIEHQTEALSDGRRAYTICGHQLAGCNPQRLDRLLANV